MTLRMALTFCTSMAKELKLKARNNFRANSYICGS